MELMFPKQQFQGRESLSLSSTAHCPGITHGHLEARIPAVIVGGSSGEGGLDFDLPPFFHLFGGAPEAFYGVESREATRGDVRLLKKSGITDLEKSAEQKSATAGRHRWTSSPLLRDSPSFTNRVSAEEMVA
jgi:hypothetical protein